MCLYENRGVIVCDSLRFHLRPPSQGMCQSCMKNSGLITSPCQGRLLKFRPARDGFSILFAFIQCNKSGKYGSGTSFPRIAFNGAKWLQFEFSSWRFSCYLLAAFSRRMSSDSVSRSFFASFRAQLLSRRWNTIGSFLDKFVRVHFWTLHTFFLFTSPSQMEPILEMHQPEEQHVFCKYCHLDDLVTANYGENACHKPACVDNQFGFV